MSEEKEFIESIKSLLEEITKQEEKQKIEKERKDFQEDLSLLENLDEE
jgi:hypothetical protein